MRVAILGTRGVPAKYGGFETCAEEISVDLVRKGHEVIVYGRKGNFDDGLRHYKGVRLFHLPRIRGKMTETFSNTFFAMIHVLFQRVDIIYVMNAANSPICIIPWLLRKKVVINVDGLEWRRRKWGRLGKAYYQWAEKLSTIFSTRIISDSMGIEEYYKKRYNTETTFIAYGAHIESSDNPSILEKYGLKPKEYLFVASRLEPENNADLTVEAFKRVNTDKLLVIAGGANYESEFIKELTKEFDPRIKFLGPVYTEGHIKALHCHCYAYVHGNEVGGTNPALLKALGYGNTVLALNVVFNSEVIGDGGILYDKSVEDLAGKIQRLVDDPGYCESFSPLAIKRIQTAYSWKRISEQYETFFKQLYNGALKG